MQISLGSHIAEFIPWNPGFGQVFTQTYAFDCETTRIDEEHRWITPAYVLGAAYDGHRGYFIHREHAGEFFRIHADVEVVMHNATFDLKVVDQLQPDLDVYHSVGEHRVWDTQLLHRLYVLGTEGHTAFGKGQSTLEHCTSHYAGIDLPKDLVDQDGDEVRLSYSKWLNKPPAETYPIYLEYLAKDVIATFVVHQKLTTLIADLLANSYEVWGYVSPQWLNEQVSRWGWLTHHIQLKAAIVLDRITANGLCIDLDRRDELLRQLQEVADECRNRLRAYGYLPGQPGSGKALQAIMKRIERGNPQLRFPRTPSGLYATKRDVIEDLACTEPFLADLLQFKAVEKLQASFLNKMGRRRLRPSFDVLRVTGRTSSFGEINSQNLPRDDRVRSCFSASEGHIFIDADYKTIELVSLGQAITSQFGMPSKMAEEINRGVDLHELVASVAAGVTGESERQITREDRQKAKPINFGKPGGMGHAGLQRYAKSSYGVELTDEEVESLSNTWFALFPEMVPFLENESDLGFAVAEFFHLTPQTYFEHTGSRQFLDHPDNHDPPDRPNSILGWMFLKTMRTSTPQTRTGRPYYPEEIDYFWHQVQARTDALPKSSQIAVLNRQPSDQLRRSLMQLVDRLPCFTLTGRLRAKASFCARHNTIFQGLAADGAKLGLWRLWRAGYRLVNFIHDQELIEVPEASNLREHAEEIRRLKIAGMKEVIPNVRVDVDYVATRRWYKNAERVVTEDGELAVWEPDNREELTAVQ